MKPEQIGLIVLVGCACSVSIGFAFMMSESDPTTPATPATPTTPTTPATPATPTPEKSDIEPGTYSIRGGVPKKWCHPRADGTVRCERDNFQQEYFTVSNQGIKYKDAFCSDQPSGMSCKSDTPEFFVFGKSGDMYTLKAAESGKYCSVATDGIIVCDKSEPDSMGKFKVLDTAATDTLDFEQKLPVHQVIHDNWVAQQVKQAVECPDGYNEAGECLNYNPPTSSPSTPNYNPPQPPPPPPPALQSWEACGDSERDSSGNCPN